MMLPDSRSSQLFDDEKEVHPMSPHRPERNVWYDRDDLALQAVQELLELTLICRHPDLEAMNSVFHGRTPIIRCSVPMRRVVKATVVTRVRRRASNNHF
jgi:hypothetical protein